MGLFNVSHPTVFLLTGIPGLESTQEWLAGPLCMMYTVALGGNIMILLAVWGESSLHAPMYYFLSMLSFSDVAMSLATLPTVFRTSMPGPLFLMPALLKCSSFTRSP